MKHGVAVAFLIAGIFVAAPAFAADGLAPGSLKPPAVDNPPSAAPDNPPADVPAAPADAEDSAAARCDNCPPPRKYDSQEVVRTRRDERHTVKTFNTYEMAPGKQAQEGNIRVRSDVTLVNFVVHRYRVIYAPEMVDVSEVAERPARAVYRSHRACRPGRAYRRGSCRPVLRVRG
jgi:hypothetical protein